MVLPLEGYVLGKYFLKSRTLYNIYETSIWTDSSKNI